MALDLQQQEELENVKRVWHSWLKWVVFFLVILAVIYLASSFWTSYKSKKNQDASDLLVNFQTALEQQQLPDALTILKKLQDNYPKTMPATIATSSIASYAFYTNNFEDAFRHFSWIYKNQKDSFVKALTLLNMAKVKMQQQQFDEALKITEEEVDSNFQFLIEDLKGDIYMAKGDNNSAQAAYDKAISLLPKSSNVISKQEISEIQSQIETKKVIRLPKL